MGKKIFLNTLYTVGIFISLMTAYWGMTKTRYEYAAAGVLVAVIFIFFKLKLLKEVRGNIKK